MNRLWMIAALASLALVLAGTGAVIPLLPLVGAAALALVWSLRMQSLALALVAVALLADNPGERPAEGKWESPVSGIGSLLYDNLHKHTGIGALRFSALEAAIGVLGVLMLSRKLQRNAVDDPDGLGGVPNPIKVAFGVFFLTVLALLLWGLVRGGDVRNALWQARQLFWLPVFGVVIGHALKTASARVALLRVIVLVACVRSLMGIYFTFAIARPAGWQLEYTMTHSDAILSVVAVLIALAALVERPTAAHALANVLVQPVLWLGLYVNDRRIAYVGLAAGLLALVLMGPAWLGRLTRQSVLALAPVAAIYLAAGWSSTAPVFAPVSTVRQLLTSADTSTQTRDIENYNLMQTLKRQPLVGSGFGHEYLELVQAYRVDHVFAQYKYIAHNSVLWLLSLSGWAGFAALWAIFPIAIATALAVHRAAVAPFDRVFAFTAVAATISFLTQAWGDMGLQSWMGTLVLASLMGATGALYTRQTAGVSA